MKTGILFAAAVVGDDAGASLVANINRLAARRFPGVDVRWSAMQHPSRDAMRAVNRPPFLPQALGRMRRDGFTHVAVQPLQVVGGSEFERLRATVARQPIARSRFPRIAVGAPLLASGADVERVVRALLAGAAPLRKRGAAVIALGHGSAASAAGLAYLAAAWMLGFLDRLAFLGCLNGPPGLDAVLRQCKAARVKRALLLPFTTAAGSTLRNALAATGPGSWVAALAAEGIVGTPVPRGLVENDDVAAVWLDHAETALKLIQPRPATTKHAKGAKGIPS